MMLLSFAAMAIGASFTNPRPMSATMVLASVPTISTTPSEAQPGTNGNGNKLPALPLKYLQRTSDGQ